MDGRVVDLATYPRRTQSQNGHTAAADGHAPTRPVPFTPTINVDLVAAASQRQRLREIPATAEGCIYLLIHPDNSFSIKVSRMGDHHGLLLTGSSTTSAPVILREIVAWLYGVPA